MRRAAVTPILAAFSLVCAALPASAAPSCELPETTLRGEEATQMSDAFKGYVTGNLAGSAQDRYAKSIIDSFTKQAAATDDLVEGITFSIKADLVSAANNWVHVLKAKTVAEAVINQDAEAGTAFVRDEAVELALAKFLEYMGASASSSVPGAVMMGLGNLKESYDELEHQDCLLNIDLAYYNFLNDPALRNDENGDLTKDSVDRYIKHYIRGGGDDPQGNPRALNRRYLQCFINETMPESERIEVSTLGPDAEESGGFFSRTFGGVTDALRSSTYVAPGSKEIRTPVLIMLKDFNARFTAEQERRKLIRLKQSAEFAVFEDTIDAMKVSEGAAQWLCDRLSGKELAELAGRWMLTLDFETPFSSDDIPFPPVEMDVPENGLVLTQMRDDTSALTVEGRVGKERVALDYLMKGWDDDANGMVDVFNLDLDGTVTETGMAGTFDGRSADFACVFSGFFDDADEGPTCGMLPAKGRWTAVPK